MKERGLVKIFLGSSESIFVIMAGNIAQNDKGKTRTVTKNMGFNFIKGLKRLNPSKINNH